MESLHSPKGQMQLFLFRITKLLSKKMTRGASSGSVPYCWRCRWCGADHSVCSFHLGSRRNLSGIKASVSYQIKPLKDFLTSQSSHTSIQQHQIQLLPLQLWMHWSTACKLFCAHEVSRRRNRIRYILHGVYGIILQIVPYTYLSEGWRKEKREKHVISWSHHSNLNWNCWMPLSDLAYSSNSINHQVIICTTCLQCLRFVCFLLCWGDYDEMEPFTAVGALRVMVGCIWIS